MENIKEYLKYYTGQKAIFEKSGRIITIRAVDELGIWNGNDWHSFDIYNFKPILRRLSDITEEDARECYAIGGIRLQGGIEQMKLGWNTLDATQFHYLISKGYWLFDEQAFTDGLIIDAKTISNT